MANLIEFEQAAAMLGINPDELTQLRSQNEVFGYRDGASWKFKLSELERYAATQGISLRDPDAPAAPVIPVVSPPSTAETNGDISPVDADLDELVDVPEPRQDSDDEVHPAHSDDSLDDMSAEDTQDKTEPPVESILVSEEELGESDPGASSTIIGQVDASDGESDLLASGKSEGAVDDSDLDVNADTVVTTDEDAAVKLETVDDGEPAGDRIPSEVGSDSEVKSAEAGGLTLEESGTDLSLHPDSSVDLTPGDSELSLNADSSIMKGVGDSGSELGLAASDSQAGPAPSDTGIAIEGSGDDLILDADGGDDDILILDDSDVGLDAGATNLNLGGGSDMSIDLSDVDIDVSAGGSDITLNAGDSGINLTSPSESGISLETLPSGLSGSGIEALELGEADAIDLEEDLEFELEDDLKSDDDFLLTPVDDTEADEESDSGSQVIALDADEFEDADMLGDDAVVLEEDPGVGEDAEAASMAGAAPLGGAPSIGAVGPEQQYTVWNVVGLSFVTLMLAITGMMLMDVIRSMWSWNEAYTVNSAIMDTIVGMFGG